MDITRPRYDSEQRYGRKMAALDFPALADRLITAGAAEGYLAGLAQMLQGRFGDEVLLATLCLLSRVSSKAAKGVCQSALDALEADDTGFAVELLREGVAT